LKREFDLRSEINDQNNKINLNISLNEDKVISKDGLKKNIMNEVEKEDKLKEMITENDNHLLSLRNEKLEKELSFQKTLHELLEEKSVLINDHKNSKIELENEIKL
jgi:hypothetical protein